MSAAWARALCQWLVGGVLLAPGLAMAQASAKPAAEALFENGKELMAGGDLPSACAKFGASQELDPAVGTLLHLGDCYERIGRTASAWAAFREAASLAEASGQTPRFEIATTRANALAPTLSYVTVHVPEDHRVANLVITLAGVTVPPASWEVRLPADPGEQPVTASAPGHATWSSKVIVANGATETDVDVPQLAALSAAAPPPGPALEPPPPPARGLGAQRIAGIVIGSVGLGGLTVGGIFGVQAMLRNDESLENCRPDDPSLCSTRGIELRDQASTFATTSTIALIAGGALAAGGLVIVLTAPSSEPQAGLRVIQPSIALRHDGLRIGGTW